jgi:hypothetical protein
MDVKITVVGSVIQWVLSGGWHFIRYVDQKMILNVIIYKNYNYPSDPAV